MLSAGAGVSYAGRPGQLGSSGKWPGYGARLFMSTQTTQAELRLETRGIIIIRTPLMNNENHCAVHVMYMHMKECNSFVSTSSNCLYN